MKLVYTRLDLKKILLILLILIILISFNFNCVAETINNDESDWLMFRHDSFHTGYQPLKGSGNIANYGLKWCTILNKSSIQGEAVVANIDLIGDKEIIIGIGNGDLYCLDPNGNIIWKFYCEKGTGPLLGNGIFNTAALFNITGDEALEIIFGCNNGKIYCLSALGKLIWKYQTNSGISSSPTIGDMTGNGDLDIVVYNNNNLYTITKEGELIWKLKIQEGGFSTPVIVDINDDGTNDIIVSGSYGRIYSISTKTTWDESENITKYSPMIQWTYDTNSSRLLKIIGSPVVFDINKDGKYEIIFGDRGKNISCLNYEGKIIWKYIVDGPIDSSPVIGDIDSDGDYEILAGTLGKRLYALESNGSLIWIKEHLRGISPDPVLFDLDGDGFLEITSIDDSWEPYGLGYSNERIIYSINIINFTGEVVHKLKYVAKGYDHFYAVSVTDLDSDGKLEILMGTKDGYLHCYGELEGQNNMDNDKDNSNNKESSDEINDLICSLRLFSVIIIILAILFFIFKKFKKKSEKTNPR